MPDDIWGDLERVAHPRTKVADTLLRIGSDASAKAAYLEIVSSILGPGFEVPIYANGGVVCPEYASLAKEKKVELMAAFVGLAECEKKAQDLDQELLWLEEVQLVYLNFRWAARPGLYDWAEWFPDDVAFSVQYARARAAASAAFLGPQNTANAVQRRWTAQEMIPSSHKLAEKAITRTILNRGATSVLLQYRHPDPLLMQNQVICAPSLQVYGSWKKLKVKKSSGGPGRRMGFSAFIWDGHLYVAGGRKDSLGPFYRDMFSIDLQTLDGWKIQPQYPPSMSQTSAFLGWHILPHPGHRKAYLFTGRATLDFFDLQTKVWGTIKTTFEHSGKADNEAGVNPGSAPWPYPKGQLTDSTQQLVGDKLYVFGGTHGTTSIGCNLFCVLDLKTRVWRRLSGSVMPTKENDPTSPGPRKTPNSWVDNKGDRFYLLFGECDRMGALYSKEMHGGDHGHTFDDFWSWSFEDGGWRRERWTGNTPCPRSEAACVYNPKMNKTVAWGGYNSNLPTDYIDHRMKFSFSYYADTFVYDGPPNTSISDSPPSTSSQPRPRQKWRQVLTTSFPTYRAQSQLLVDPQSGRTFLFGGFTNNDYIPTRKEAISRSFGDIWELRIDVTNGGFSAADGVKIDVDLERRTARVGPWQRCFACGSAGDGRKCGGTCGGKVFFCDTECLKEGWKEHRTTHGCRKT